MKKGKEFTVINLKKLKKL